MELGLGHDAGAVPCLDGLAFFRQVEELELRVDSPTVAARLLDHLGVAIIFAPRRLGLVHTTDPLIQTMGRFSSRGGDFPDDMQVEVSSIWAMCDFTEENGATRVVPDSHTDADPRSWTMADTVPAVMPRGSIVLYTGRTVHGGGANTSTQTRTGVNVDYVLGWLRQEENQYLSVPLDVVRQLPERIQRLMGYAMGAYALGYIDDVRNPMRALDTEPTTEAASSFAPSN